MMPVEKTSRIKSERKNMPNRYSVISLVAPTFLSRNWNPSKNRMNSVVQKMALLATTMPDRNRDPARIRRIPFLISWTRRPASARAGLADVVDLRLGDALVTLPQLAAERRGPFDLIFIDADKPSIPDYFTWALKLSRRGSIIIVDNVVRKGEVINAASTDPNVQGVRRFNEMLAAEPRVSATALQTVGSKGYDGFTIALCVA